MSQEKILTYTQRVTAFEKPSSHNGESTESKTLFGEVSTHYPLNTLNLKRYAHHAR
jgi:hypothetical protein